MSSQTLFRRLLAPTLALTRRRPPMAAPAVRRLPTWGPPRPRIDPKEVELRVVSALAKHDKIDANSLSLQSHLSRDLGLDSLDVIECVVQLEDEFALDIPDADVERLLTVQAVVQWVVARLEAAPDENRRPQIEFKEGMTHGRPMN